MRGAELEAKYRDKAPVGVYGENNFGGLEILDIEGGEYAVACFNNGECRQDFGRHKIQYTANGRPYIRKFGTRYYFDTIMGRI